MKRILGVLLAVLAVNCFCIAAFAADIKVIVNGSEIESQIPPEIKDSATMLPFRSILNALGVKDEEIKWDAASNCIEVNSGGSYVFIAIGNTGAIVNDQLIEMPVAAYVKDGYTLVPVRFLSEAFSAQVDWNQESKTVTITK